MLFRGAQRDPGGAQDFFVRLFHLVGIDAGREAEVHVVAREAPEAEQPGVIDLVVGDEDAGPGGRLEPDVGGQSLHRTRDREGRRAQAQGVPRPDRQLRHDGRIDQRVALRQTAPHAGRIGGDLAIEGKARLDAAQLHEPRESAALGQRHRDETGHAGGVRTVRDQGIDDSRDGVGDLPVRAQPCVSAQQAPVLGVYGPHHIVSEGVEGHKRGHADGDRRHVDAQAAQRGPPLAPRHPEGKPVHPIARRPGPRRSAPA